MKMPAPEPVGLLAGLLNEQKLVGCFLSSTLPGFRSLLNHSRPILSSVDLQTDLLNEQKSDGYFSPDEVALAVSFPNLCQAIEDRRVSCKEDGWP